MRIHKPSVVVVLLVLAFWWYFGPPSGKLKQIHLGMSQSEVKGLLGSPQKIYREPQGEQWHYSSLRLPDVMVYFDTNAVVRHVAEK